MQLRDLFDEFPLGRGEVVPIALPRLLGESLDVYADAGRAERLLLETHALLPERPEIAIALYKLYAYTNRFDEALALIDEVLAKAAEQGGFPPDWRALHRESAPWDAADGPVRIYLYSLKALGFVRLRRGELGEALAVLERLARLDRTDQVGGSVVHAMAQRLTDSEETA